MRTILIALALSVGLSASDLEVKEIAAPDLAKLEAARKQVQHAAKLLEAAKRAMEIAEEAKRQAEEQIIKPLRGGYPPSVSEDWYCGGGGPTTVRKLEIEGRYVLIRTVRRDCGLTVWGPAISINDNGTIVQ